MGKTLFVITHDPEFILSCCTYFLQFESGSILANERLDAQGSRQMLGYFLNAADKRKACRESEPDTSSNEYGVVV
jgi:energy-coupling factor transport system ATP-binding protein